MISWCQKVIEPSLKLSRMLKFLKYILLVQLLLMMIDIIFIQTNIFFLLFIQLFITIFGIMSINYSLYLILILVCFFNLYIIFKILGKWFIVGFYKNDSSFTFCYIVLIFVFEIFFIFYTFQLYKQSKHEYRIKYGYVAGQNDEGENIENDENVNENINQLNNNNENNNEEFLPFQGRGIAVGGS